jgi:outer membrane cobalamin receptor
MTSKAYTLASLGLEWSGLRGLKLYLRVENIGDKVYEPVVGYGSARRSATVGGQWAF